MSDLMQFFGEEGFTGVIDGEQIKPQGNFELLPPGKYLVEIIETDVKETQKRDGHYIELVLRIIEGKYANRRLWDRINFDNPNSKCVGRALSTVEAIKQAVGVPNLKNTDQLLGHQCIAVVRVHKDQNSVQTYKSKDEQEMEKEIPAETTEPASAATSDNDTLPWDDK